jgi:hypothetical protein
MFGGGRVTQKQLPQTEKNSVRVYVSALPLSSDIARRSRHFVFVPTLDSNPVSSIAHIAGSETAAMKVTD